MLVTDLFRRAAQAWPDRCFLHTGGNRYTYAQLWNQSVAVASWLAERGVGRGDRVLLYGRHGAEYVAALVGTLLQGAVAVPLCHRVSRARLNRLLRDAAPRAIAADASLLPRLHDHVRPGQTAVLQLRGPNPQPDRCNIEGLSGGLPDDSAPVDPGDPAVLVYARRNDGPHAVAFSHKNLIAALVALLAEFAVHRSDRTRLTLPLHWPGGLAGLFVHAAAGAELVLEDDDDAPTNGDSSPEPVNALWTSASGLAAELDTTPIDGTLDYIACWGLLPADLHRRATEALGRTELFAVYHHPEAAGPIAFQCDEASPLHGIPCRIARGLRLSLDATDPCPPEDEDGARISVSGPTVAEWLWKDGRYHRRSGRTTIRDCTTLGDDGTLYILDTVFAADDSGSTAADRAKLLEHAISIIPAVEAAAVIVVDTEAAEQLWAFVQPADGARVRPADIQQHPVLKEHGVGVDNVVIVGELPRRDGAIDRRRLLEKFARGAGGIKTAAESPPPPSHAENDD